MKDPDDASFVLGIETYRDISLSASGLSERAYIENILKWFNMHTCSPGKLLC